MDEALCDQVLRLSARLHAATAELTRLAAELDDSNAWAGIGLASCAHWLSINAGFELWTAGALIEVGHALRSLPLIREAFAQGRLSFDKVRALVSVATPDDQAAWLEIGLNGSGAQVGRICRAFGRATLTDDPDRSTAQFRKRRLVTWMREDGMLEVFATLPPEDGAVLLNALQAAMQGDLAQQPAEASLIADQPVAARRADALVAVCERYLEGTSTDGQRERALPRVVVHVDAAVLAQGADAAGRCHLENGPALAAEAARRLACDAEIETVVERDAEPVAVSARGRVIRGRQRRLMHLRDQTCRYPGCSVPAQHAEGHHVDHWITSRDNSLANMVSLCAFHHHRHHDGEFIVLKTDDGGFRFLTRGGKPIQPAALRADTADAGLHSFEPEGASVERARAGDGGAPCDMDHTVYVLAGNRALQEARAGRSP